LLQTIVSNPVPESVIPILELSKFSSELLSMTKSIAMFGELECGIHISTMLLLADLLHGILMHSHGNLLEGRRLIAQQSMHPDMELFSDISVRSLLPSNFRVVALHHSSSRYFNPMCDLEEAMRIGSKTPAQDNHQELGL
jgi:hypothetical protein